jgi:hypothetical protein
MNQKANGAAIANQLVSCFIPGGIFQFTNEMYRSFGLESGISVPHTNSLEYAAALRLLFELDKRIRDSYSLSTFEKRVAEWLRPHVLGKTTINASAVKSFLQELSAVPLTNCDVFRPIFGIKLSSDDKAAVLGPYTVYDAKLHLERVTSGLLPRLQQTFEEESSPFLIKVTVSAREFSKAIELADVLFERFENTIRFMLGQRVSQYEVGVLNYQGLIAKHAIVVFRQQGSSSREKEGATRVLPIDDAYFIDSEKGFDAIWGSFDSTSMDELRKRVLLAVDWIGQSLAERVPSSAFIKATIALEILFTPQKGEFVTPSIVSQLSESVALLLGTDVKSRIQLEADVKRLYTIRSGVAHSGKSDVKPSDLAEIQQLARVIVMKMLTTPALQTVSTVVGMFQLFKSIKYSCAPL